MVEEGTENGCVGGWIGWGGTIYEYGLGVVGKWLREEIVGVGFVGWIGMNGGK